MIEKETYTINDIKQLLKEYNKDKYGGYDRNYYVTIYIQGEPLTSLFDETDFYTPEEIDKAWYAHSNTLTYTREDFYLGAYKEDYFIQSSHSDKTIIKKFVYKVKENFRIYIYLVTKKSKKVEVEEQKDTQIDSNLPYTLTLKDNSITFKYNLKFDFNKLFYKPYCTIFIKKIFGEDDIEIMESCVYAIIPNEDCILAAFNQEKYKYSDYGITWAFTREELLKKE